MQSTDIFHPPMPSQSSDRLTWTHLHGASTGLALAQAIQQHPRPFLIIAPDNLYVAHLIDECRFFGVDATNLLHFPDWETLPYDHFSPHQDIVSDRLSALCHLPGLKKGAVITTVSTILQRLAPTAYIEGHSFQLKQGDVLNIDELRSRLTKAGYYSVSQVRVHGEFAVRGSIIDLFPMGSNIPFRIDLLDDEVDSIRLFSPETQRSQDKIAEIKLLPAKEFPLTDESIDTFRHHWRSQFAGNPLKCPTYQDISEGICTPGIEYYLPFFHQQTATIFDYLPKNTLIVTIEDVLTKANEFWQEIEFRYEQGRYDISRPLLEPKQIFIPTTDLMTSINAGPLLQINHANGESINFTTEPALNLDINHKAAQPLASLETFEKNYAGRILFCAESIGRREVILQLFKSISLQPTFFHSWEEFLASKEKLGIAVTPIENGFGLTSPALTLITENQLYGKRVMQRRLRKRTAQDTESLINDLTELQLDDPIVHLDHGVGRYRGLQTLTVDDQIAEFLCLEYQNEVKLYVPVSSLHLVSRYNGSDPDHVPMNKLGTDYWQRAKKRATEKIKDVAAELLDLYAKRAARPGHTYTIPEDQYSIFANAFPFEETPDQLQAIEQVFKDMTSDKPMDRVICGDVGFGKTEVALRAAFLAVQNNKQVAILVPTTLLAQQHFKTFQDRFADWPIQVEMLSRFRTGKETKEVLSRLEEGKVDIVIGTHKLLQADIKFKALGLVIIDEEHRFGVTQKEKLKALRAMVDILTLTATPIPRTLNMALAGIRDLSIIATPPARRLSVKTFVHEYQNQLIQEAIQREILRGGQVYFLHNDVSSIGRKAEEISELVGEARVAVAHGQMHERDLERVMTEFYHRHFNVLVCSTIIESGIDIPTANTIIINRADKFGLAQLHQLRGRVGRSHHQSYAYLLAPARNSMTADAVKRLDAISALDKLGVGFTLASHDLEIRGAGELLGEQQSGDMQEIGFTLYMDLLTRAVDALKEGKEIDLEKSLLNQRSEIDLRLTVLIPDDYLGDVQLRLLFYKRIANAKSASELDEIQVEMIDRFGLLPPALKNLFAVSEIKLKAQALGIIKLEAGEKGGKIEFSSHPMVKPETIIMLIQEKSQRFRLDGPTRLRFTLPAHLAIERISLTEKIIEALQA